VPLPDIYVIILDSYLRDDVLHDIYGVDNSEFLFSLEQRGFFIARNARSNHTHTALTVSSMLNYDYLDSLSKTTGLDTLAESHLGTMIHNNRTFHQLDCLGYKVTTLSNGFYYTDFPESDHIISTGTYPSSFAYQLAASTPLTLFTLQNQYNTLRERMFRTFEEVQKIPQSENPQFVYAHLMFGHPPFLFNIKGEEVNPLREMRFDSTHYFKSQVVKDDFVNEYKNQVTFLAGKVLQTVDGILANSKEPPIIIMMGDHGPSFLDATNWERFSIFNAYYFPGGKTSQLYQGITPVNSLRVVFDTYFDAGLPLLPDISNLAPPNNLYETLDVTQSIPDNKN
jgi:glucan phosphoethanolaminetransferase (alkaline phosphatase superfamily)